MKVSRIVQENIAYMNELLPVQDRKRRVGKEC